MSKTTKVGALVLAALVIAGVAIFLLGRQEHVWERKARYVLHFARTNGLQAGAPVSLSGLPIGSVEALRFASEPNTDIVVNVAVDADAATRIRTDTKATIRTLGLLGDKYIELVPGSDPAATPVPAGGVIRTVDPTDYEALVGESGGDIVTNVVEVTSSLRDVLQTIQRGEGLLGAMVTNREFGDRTLHGLDDTLHNVKETSARLDGVLARIDRGEGLLGRLVRDEKLATSLDRTARALDRVTQRLEHGEGAAMRLIDDRAYGDRLLAKLDRAIEDLASVVAKLDRGEGTLGKLVNDPALYDESKGLVHDMRNSWTVKLYEAFHGIWPSGSSPSTPKPVPEAPR